MYILLEKRWGFQLLPKISFLLEGVKVTLNFFHVVFFSFRWGLKFCHQNAEFFDAAGLPCSPTFVLSMDRGGCEG